MTDFINRYNVLRRLNRSRNARQGTGGARYEFEREEMPVCDSCTGPNSSFHCSHLVGGHLDAYLNDETPLPHGCWLAWPHEGRCQRLTERRRVEG